VYLQNSFFQHHVTSILSLALQQIGNFYYDAPAKGKAQFRICQSVASLTEVDLGQDVGKINVALTMGPFFP